MVNLKTLILEKPFNLKFKTSNLNVNNLKRNEIFCKTLFTAISPGSETAHYQGFEALAGKSNYPRTLGYCNLAKIIKKGSSVNQYKLNDYILTFESHRSHFIIDESLVLSKVSKDIKPEDAVCAYLFHLGYSSLHKTNIKYGTKVVVIGLGALGLGALSIFKNAGAQVFSITDQLSSSRISKKIGANKVYKRTQINKLYRELGPGLADVVITTTSSWNDWDIALDLAGVNATVGVLGFPGRNVNAPTKNPLHSKNFYIKQLSIISLGLSPTKNDERSFLRYNEKSNIEFILNEIKAKKIIPGNLVNKVLSANSIEKAYKSIISRKSNATTYVLKW